jgi:hypothetical protein
MPHFDIVLQHVLLIWALAFLRAEENGMRLLHFMAENGPFGLLASELNKTQNGSTIPCHAVLSVTRSHHQCERVLSGPQQLLNSFLKPFPGVLGPVGSEDSLEQRTSLREDMLRELLVLLDAFFYRHVQFDHHKDD